MDCIFCKIADGTIPTEFIFESDAAVVFRDLHPKAPTHLLAIPRKHVTKISELTNGSELLSAVAEGARRAGVVESGYRVVVNQGSDGGQEVPHLHFHILGGRQMTWPPG